MRILLIGMDCEFVRGRVSIVRGQLMLLFIEGFYGSWDAELLG